MEQWYTLHMLHDSIMCMTHNGGLFVNGDSELSNSIMWLSGILKHGTEPPSYMADLG